jgi:hypothetical protein
MKIFNTHEVDDPLVNLGQKKEWSLEDKYQRNLSDITAPFPDGRRKHSVPIKDPSVMPSLKKLNNKHLGDFSD